MFYIWKDELRNVFKDAGVMIFLFLVPFVYSLFYSSICSSEIIYEAKMVVVDQNNSYLSRESTRRINTTPDVEVVGVCPDMAEVKKVLDKKKAYGILFFLPDYSKGLCKGRQIDVSLYCDMSVLLFYKAFLLATTGVSLNMGKELRTYDNPPSTDKMDQVTADPIPHESVALFNFQNGFASLLVPTTLTLVSRQTLILGVGMLGRMAREKSHFHGLASIYRRLNGILHIIFGESLIHLLLYVVVYIWALAIVPRLFSLPQVGGPLTILLFLLSYLFACISMSMTLSGFVTSCRSPMLVFVFTSITPLSISGASWPETAIPPFWKVVGYLFPSTPGIQGFIRINTIGASLYEVVHEYRVLWIQADAYFILSCVTYHYQIIRSRKMIIKQRRRMKMQRTLQERG